jgi:hypothetical protein
MTAVTSAMWGVGLRWNAYFNPVFLVLYTVALAKGTSVIARAAILAIGTVFLFHTSYMTFAAAPVLWGTLVGISYRRPKSGQITRIALILVATGIACLPQLYVLLTVHLPIYAPQHSWSILYSVAQSIYTLMVGNAVFPLDYVPCLFAVLLVAACLSSAHRVILDSSLAPLIAGVILGLALLNISRLGVEGRNAVFLYPIALSLIAIAIVRSSTWIRIPAVASFMLLQTIGVYDFVFHHDTAKGSFNTPFAPALEEIAISSRTCPGKTYVFTHEPVLTYLLEQSGARVSSPYEPTDLQALSLREMDCVLTVSTYRGVLPAALYAEYNQPLDPMDFRGTRKMSLGYDRFHEIKQLIGSEPFPEYYITIETYQVLHSVSIPDWYHLAQEL